MWKHWFRIPKVVFNVVLDKISKLDVFKVPINVGARAVEVDRQLAIFCLRTKGLPVMTIQSNMDVSPSTVSAVTFRVCLAILEAFPDTINFAKNGTARKQEQMDAFAEAGFPGARCVIDVTKVKTKVEAKVLRAGNRNRWADRKGNIVSVL